MRSAIRLTVPTLSLALFLAGCPNPANDVPAAQVSEPAAAPSEAEPTTAPAAGEEAAAPEAPAATTTLAFSNEGSEVLFTGSKVTGSHDGGFHVFTGAIELVDNDPLRSSVRVEIQTDSLFSDNERLTGHLKSDDFFDVAQFPTASFQSTSIAAGGEGGTHTITGNLTLHGVTKQIAFPATVAMDGGNVSVTADFAINRKDFDIVFAGQPDDLIRDEVVIRLRIRANAG